jgi:aspartate-semialdehyde dehydrogenase
MTDKFNIAVVGATGAVGTMMLKLLQERGFPVGRILPLASRRSAGKQIEYAGKQVTVEELTPDSFSGVQIALFSAGSGRSREYAPTAAEAGAVVIDNSSAFRMEPNVPLVVPEVNPDDIKWHEGIIANPNCSTIQMVVPLKAIQEAVGIERVVVTTMQSVSGTGNRAVQELFNQSEAVLESGEVEVDVYPHRIAFNIIPHIEHFHDNGYTNEEIKMIDETRKILGDPDMRVTATCTRVPIFNAHSESLNIQTKEAISADAVRELMHSASGMVVQDDPSEDEYPMPLMAQDRDEVFVGRIREDDSAENCINIWIVSDNLRKGAATNAIQIAELLVAEGLID